MMSNLAIRRLIWSPWTGEIMVALSEPKRFNELLNGITGISDRVLTERLRALEILGLVTRKVDAGPPVRVSYSLTWDALPLVGPLEELMRLTAV